MPLKRVKLRPHASTMVGQMLQDLWFILAWIRHLIRRPKHEVIGMKDGQTNIVDPFVDT